MNLLNQAREEIDRLLKLVNQAEGNKKDYYELLKVIWSENEEYILITFPYCYGMVRQKTSILIQYLEEQGFNDVEVGEDYLVIPYDSKNNNLQLILLMFSEIGSKNFRTRDPVQLQQLKDNLQRYVLTTSNFDKGNIEKVFGFSSIIYKTPLMTKLWESAGFDVEALKYHSRHQAVPTFHWVKENVAKVSLACGYDAYDFEVYWVDNPPNTIETKETTDENHDRFRNYIASMSITHNTSLGCYGNFIELVREGKFATLFNPEYDNHGRLVYLFQKIADVTKLGLSNDNYLALSMDELDGLTKEYLRLRDLLKSLD